MIHQKKNRDHRTSKIVKSRQSYSNDHLPYRCSFLLLSARSMYDLLCEFACAVRMRRNKCFLRVLIGCDVIRKVVLLTSKQPKRKKAAYCQKISCDSGKENNLLEKSNRARRGLVCLVACLLILCEINLR